MLINSILSHYSQWRPCRQIGSLLPSFPDISAIFSRSSSAPFPHNFSVICRRGRYSGPHAQAASPLFNVPLDIFLVICDVLPLASLVFLSQTCFDARSRLEGICLNEISRLDSNAYIDFLVDLAFALPNYQVCARCSTLHHVDVQDFPSSEYRRKGYMCMRRPTRPTERRDYYSFGESYFLTHYHVQLALKYHRLKHSYQGYLENLMAPYLWISPTNRSSKTTCAAKPMIVNGEFLLFTTWTFENKQKKSDLPDLIRSFMICPHISCRACDRVGGPIRLVDDLDRIVLDPRIRITKFCRRCPTDLKLYATGSKLKCHVWQNMGRALSQNDDTWHIFCSDVDNTWLTDLNVRHKPNSIRNKYIKHESMQNLRY